MGFVNSPQVLLTLECAVGGMLAVLCVILAYAYSRRLPPWTIGAAAVVMLLCLIAMSGVSEALAQFVSWLR
jgi:membrane protein YdbS with pleckstrin-like domain